MQARTNLADTGSRLLGGLRRTLGAATITLALMGPAPGLAMAQGAAAAQREAEAAVWFALDQFPDKVVAGEGWGRPQSFAAFALDLAMVRAQLAAAPDESVANAPPVVIAVPRPDGRLEHFEVFRTYVLDRGLSAKYPEIMSFAGNGIENPSSIVRVDLNPLMGFRAMVYGPEGTYHVDPFTKGDTAHFASHWARAFPARGLGCLVPPDAKPVPTPAGGAPAGTDNNGQTLRTFRLAVATTGEWTIAHGGGTVAGGLAAMTSIVNQVTGVYQVEFAIRMTIVPNNDLIIYTNGATDPFTNGNAGTVLGEATVVIPSQIGIGNFDFGHVFGTDSSGGSGVAILGAVCNNTSGRKAGGVSLFWGGLTDPFNRTLVMHEMGHQFNAGHSFNSAHCDWAWSASSAHEPGSGSTFMSYNGLCGPDDLGSFDDYPHAFSFNQITAFAATSSCRVDSATGNGPPVVNAGANRTIPAHTPFELNPVSVTDPNGHPVTVKWEQMNLSPAMTTLAQGDTGRGPIIRSRRATTATNRNFPLNFTAPNSGVIPPFPPGDILPTTNRAGQDALIFRATALDNRAAAGGVGFGSVTLTVTTAAGPFRVVSPNGNESWTCGSPQTVTWNVASTNLAPVSAANVEIRLSTDGGATFPTVLMASTPNDGEEIVTLPGVYSANARIRVKAVGNYFFDLSDRDFTINPGTSWLPVGAGASGRVEAVTTWDPDGPGPMIPQLVAGGTFVTAGGVTVNRIARWDGNQWQPFGTGMNDAVLALTTWDPDGTGPLHAQLVAAGRFTTAGGVTVNRIARWTGSQWVAFGSGMNDWVESVTTWDPDGTGPLPEQLVAGGRFTTAGGLTANRIIARWDGTQWLAFGTGLNFSVEAVTTWDPDGSGPLNPQVVAGGWFTASGGTPVSFIARWDGAQWQPLSTGMDAPVFALISVDPDGSGPLPPQLIAGGGFTVAGGTSASFIASWDGTRWSPLGSGMSRAVLALATGNPSSPLGSQLVAAGEFTSAGGGPVSYIAHWNGSIWTPLGAGLNNWGYSLTTWDPDGTGPRAPQLIAGGDFTAAGGSAASRIARMGCSCRADYNGDGALDFNDFLAYMNDFNAGNPRADLNGDGVIDFNDFLDFLNAFNTGC